MPTSTDVFAKIHGHDREALLAAARESDLLPYFRTVESPALPIVEMEGTRQIMLASNNYLGLTADERVIAGARDALDRYGTGLTGSRLLNGTTPLHLDLERELAEWMGTESVLVFTTGHQANVGTLATLLSPSDTVIVDSADHASILDGVLLSRAKMRPFRHNRLDKLDRALARAAHDGGGTLVVVDGVFSMEGDIAPMCDIVELCAHHGARLMVDEAHGVGVLGARGAGACELLGVEELVDLRMGTFSKSLAACGGFIAGPREVIDYLRVSSRAFLFTASGVPAALGAALAALRVIRSPEGPPLMAQALRNASHLADGLRASGYEVLRGDPVRLAPEARPTLASLGVATEPSEEADPRNMNNGAPPAQSATAPPDDRANRSGDDRRRSFQSIVTPIVPILVGDDWRAALLWRALYDEGVFTNCAIHPAVGPGEALLRTSVMATHTPEMIDEALTIFAAVKQRFEADHGPLPGARAS